MNSFFRIMINISGLLTLVFAAHGIVSRHDKVANTSFPA